MYRTEMPTGNDQPTKGPKLPSDRAFVVQLNADSDPARGVYFGQIEHVRSGRRARFHSAKELERFLAEVVAALGHDRGSPSEKAMVARADRIARGRTGDER